MRTAGRCCGCCRPWRAPPRSRGASPAARRRWSRCCWRWSACRRSTSSGPAASIITMCRSRSRCSSSPRPCGPTACAGRPGGRRAHRPRAGDRARMPALSGRVRRRLRGALRRGSRRRAGRPPTTAWRLRQSRSRLSCVIVGPAIGDAAPATPSRSTGSRWSLTGGLGLGARRHTVRAAPRCRRASRCVGATAALATALFVWIEPRCLGGSLRHDGSGGVADLARHVREMQPLISLMADKPGQRDRDRDLPGGGAGRRRPAAARRAHCGATSDTSRRRPPSWRPSSRRSRRSRPIPTRPGSACRWSRPSRCICSRRCGCSRWCRASPSA